MISYHVVPFQDGWRISVGTTEVKPLLIGGRRRMTKVTRFEADGATYPSRAAAQAVLRKLAEV
jgi:hypothetical protein